MLLKTPEGGERGGGDVGRLGKTPEGGERGGEHWERLLKEGKGVGAMWEA